MTDTITDVTTTVTSAEDMKAEARNDNRVHIGYLAGVHEDGSKCSACLRFDAANIPSMREHGEKSEIVRIELQLSYEAFNTFAESMGGTLSSVTDENGNPKILMNIGGKSFPASTPTLFAYTVDNAGQVRITDVFTGQGSFGAWLTNVENMQPEARLSSAMETARAQALAALSDGKSTGSTVPNYNSGPQVVAARG